MPDINTNKVKRFNAMTKRNSPYLFSVRTSMLIEGFRKYGKYDWLNAKYSQTYIIFSQHQ